VQAIARTCEGVVKGRVPNIEILTRSRILQRNYEQTVEQISNQYGEDSAQAAFVRDNTKLPGLTGYNQTRSIPTIPASKARRFVSDNALYFN
jgi:hypothetical protein